MKLLFGVAGLIAGVVAFAANEAFKSGEYDYSIILAILSGAVIVCGIIYFLTIQQDRLDERWGQIKNLIGLADHNSTEGEKP